MWILVHNNRCVSKISYREQCNRQGCQVFPWFSIKKGNVVSNEKWAPSMELGFQINLSSIYIVQHRHTAYARLTQMKCLCIDLNNEIALHVFKAKVSGVFCCCGGVLFLLFVCWLLLLLFVCLNIWQIFRAGIIWNPVASHVCQIICRMIR